MGKYNLDISDSSTWITHTPTQLVSSLPFYITESGHFYAHENYSIERTYHDSFLLLYTISGSGLVKSGENNISLQPGSAVLIDCHNIHSYATQSSSWEFLWFHIKGDGVKPMHSLIYPERVFPLFISIPPSLVSPIDGDVFSCAKTSSALHDIFNSLIKARLSLSEDNKDKNYTDYIDIVIARIQKEYSLHLSIDEIIKDIPLSKYHFIRIFKLIMGVTPYHYLTVYRINMAKTLLRTSNLSVNEIAFRTGFSDTSNFINHFKKHTGQKPLEYRRYFSYSPNNTLFT